MRSEIKISCLNFLLIALFTACNPTHDLSVSSPDSSIRVNLNLTETGALLLQASYRDTPVLVDSRMGIKREDGDFINGLSLIKIAEPVTVTDSYKLLHGKKAEAIYKANQRIFSFENTSGSPMNIIVQVSDDGFVFRYAFPDTTMEVKKISMEQTLFNFVDSTQAWIQPRAKSKTGWNQVNPSYEEHYLVDTLLASLTPNDSGWIFPVLLKTPACWVSITESWPEGNYCGSHLNKGERPNELSIAFPEPTEGYTARAVYPESSLPWSTPWRIVTMGSLKTLLESTLGTDVASPSIFEDVSYVKPGRASWSWALMKDPSVNYATQLEFIDYAAEMSWEYCLIDVNWDTQIGWQKMEQLARHARKKGVSLILWYNSAGDWNTVPYHPKDLLLNTESRQKEFARIHELGVKGIKVDFFGGDGQSMMTYYEDILKDAHKYQLVVNCHGATLPRGLQRTYPNLVSMESVRGFEYATFGQETADRVPIKATILPFTRNIFDPMDFTPVCFNDYDNFIRVTGNAAELAQAVLFLSGVQHYAETPAGMANVPEYVREIMKDIPVSWDETLFIDGYPGSYIILARRNKDRWYVAGINAGTGSKEVRLDLPFLKDEKVQLVTEGKNLRSFDQQKVVLKQDSSLTVTLKSNGGFVLTNQIHE